MFIRNTEKRVIVLKANGKPVIRLFPGDNDVDMMDADLKPYLNNKAAAAYFADGSLVIVKAKEAKAKEAKVSKAKNDKLNKGKVTKSPTKPKKDAK